MRSLALALLVILGLGAAEDAPDPAFVAKVEQALAMIHTRQVDAASADFKALGERLAKNGVAMSTGDARASLFDLNAVQMRSVRIGGGHGVSLGFPNPAAAEAAATRLEGDAIVAGCWIFVDLGPAAALTDLAGAMGGRIYTAKERSLGPVVPAPDPALVWQRAREAGAAARLKSEIFVAQVQFQGGAYLDLDMDNVGEYGLIGQLAGRIPTNKVQVDMLQLVQRELARSDEAQGFRYKAWLPGADATSAVSTWEELQAVKAPDANLRERYWTVYAWPAAGSDGKVFAVTEDGQVRSQAWDGKEPAWNAVRGGKGWSDPAVWPPVAR